MTDQVLQNVLALREPTALARPVVGTMNFGRRTGEAESLATLAFAIERGLTHFDTANAYTDGESERLLGRAVKAIREKVVIATKCGFGKNVGKPEGLSKPRLLAAIDESLTRLGTDYVDVYYLHVPDRQTPIEETLDGIGELFAKKKIRAWGISNYAAWQVLEMFPLAEARGIPRPAIAQQLYNVLVRQLDVEWIGFAGRYALHTTIYNPLAGGLLTGKHARDGSTQKGSRFDKNRLYQGRYFTDAMFDRVEALSGVATAHGMPLLDLAYRWAAGAPGVDSVLLGPASIAQLQAGLDALDKPLDPAIRKEVDALHRGWLGTDTYYVR